MTRSANLIMLQIRIQTDSIHKIPNPMEADFSQLIISLLLIK